MTDSCLKRLDAYLQETLKKYAAPAEKIHAAIAYALFPGGKRLRARLVYYTGKLLEVDIRCLDVLAAAVEVMHCYSLIHDDLPAMDNDDFRRGKPSCHKAFDEATAILAGDGMQALAIELLLEELPQYVDNQQAIAVAKTLLKASGIAGMVSGQSLDLDKLTGTVSEKQLQEIHRLKTGCLIEACINMVLELSSAKPSEKNDLQKFSAILGLVFQMQDDYLDYYSNGQLLGKNRASDKENEKTTFASLYSQTALYQLIESYYDQALHCLISFEESQRQCFVDLLHGLRERSRAI